MTRFGRDAFTLPRRIVLLVLGVTSLAVVVASWVLIDRQEAIFRNDLERRSVAIARSVAEYCVGPLAFDDRAGAEAILSGLTSSELVRNAAVYDADGNLFASHKNMSAPNVPSRAPHVRATQRLGTEGLIVVVPIQFGGRRDGTLRVVVSTEALGLARRELLITVAMILVALIVATTLLATWLRRFVTQPLLSLAETMESTAHDASEGAKVPIARGDEIEILLSVFDKLRRRLARRERERDASEASVRALVAALPDAVLVLDAELMVVDAPMPRRVGSRDALSLVGHRICEALPDGVAEEVEQAAREALDRREIRTVHFDIDEGNTKRGYEAVASPMPPISGADDVPRAILLVRDVTDRRAIETRALQAEKLQAIGQLAGGIAHDFNNLLAVIVTNAALVERVSPVKAKVLLHDLREAAQRATDLVSQLLAFARRKNAVRVRTDVSELVSRVVRIVSRTVDPRIRLRTDLGDHRSFVEADVAQLESALINLAVNARDAMPEGGEIVFRTRWVDDETRGQPLLEITVSDTGSGIPPDVLPHVFEPFFTTKPVGRGTGLGLSAVYGTVQAHGGTLTVETEVSRGTTFRIRLPRSAPASIPAPAISPMPAEKPSGHILFVEDDPAVRESTRFALELAGFTVEAFESAIESLKRVRRGDRFDIALVDNVMPEMTGRELMKQLRAVAGSLPILLCSGGDIEADESVGAAHPDDFLAKPYSVEELTSRIVALLAARRTDEHSVRQ